MSDSGSDGPGDRWANALADEEENEEMVENVYIEDSEEEEQKLEEVFDQNTILMEAGDECYFCPKSKGLLTSLYNCQKCGKRVCDLCSKNERRLS